MTINSDVWSDWLLHNRHGNNAAFNLIMRPAIIRYADRVLDGAQLRAGMTFADIGTGDGLLAFRAIERIGPSLNVIMTDISAPMLHHAQTISQQQGTQSQCTFLLCSAEELHAIPDASVDVLATRAVLAYVHDKSKALSEFYRVLKPGGRISFAEPILRDDALIVCALKKALDQETASNANLFMRLMHRWKSAQFPDTEEKINANPLTNYTERDLVKLAHDAKFTEIHLELHIDVAETLITSWDVYLTCSPHPLAPSLSVVMAEQFSAEERDFFEKSMRPTIENDRLSIATRMTYLTATKPAMK